MNVYRAQCDQIGRFLQVIGNKESHKSKPNILVTFWAISFKKCVATFWAILGKIRQLFILSSGHTDRAYTHTCRRCSAINTS